ncbi:MAG: LysR family transcriptional regulator [Rhodospirillales bacterium]
MLREIQTFVTACRVGTFTEAGNRLGLTQSAVSDQIKRLEGYVGRRLFYRTRRSVSLNAAGEEILPLAEQILGLAEQMRSRTTPGQLRGSIRVGSITSMYNGLLTRAMEAFCKDHPKVKVRLFRGEDGTDEGLLDRVSREKLDMAITIMPHAGVPPEIEWCPLLQKEYIVVAPATTDATTWRDALTQYPLIRYEPGTPTAIKIDDFLSRENIDPQESIFMNYYETIVSFVGRGMGASIIPDSDLGDAIHDIKIFKLGKDAFHRQIGVLRRRGEPSPLRDTFLSALMIEARSEPHSEVPQGSDALPDENQEAD